MAAKIRSFREYEEKYQHADVVRGYAIHKMTPQGDFAHIRKLELFAFYDLDLLDIVTKNAKRLPEYKVRVPINLTHPSKDHDELFLRKIEWDGALMIIKCYRHPFDPQQTFKLELIKQVQKKVGRTYIAPFSAVSSMIKLHKKLTQNAQPVSHTHSRPFLPVADFLREAELNLEGGRLKEFERQRNEFCKNNDICYRGKYNDFF